MSNIALIWNAYQRVKEVTMSQNIVEVVEKWVKKNPKLNPGEQKKILDDAHLYQAGDDMRETDEERIERIIKEMQE